MITRERIEQTLSELRKQYQQLMDNGNALGGAIQICEQFLAEDTAPPKPPVDISDLKWIGPGPDPRTPPTSSVDQ